MIFETGTVARTIGVDFIYFDIIFLIIWIGFMIKKKYWIPLIWGFIGFIVYIITEVVIWYWLMGVRHYNGPLNVAIFFIWFSFSAGFAQFSYVFLMMEKRNMKEIIFWTVLFYLGWTFVSLGSQLIPINDALIEVSREMNEGNQRIIFSILTIINLILGLGLVYMKKIRIQDVVYLFIIGILVEFCLEFTLSISGIRQQQGTWSLEMMIINTLIEFNMGIIIMYIIFVGFKVKRDENYYDPLGIVDFKEIKTDFNAIAAISNNKKINKNRIKEYVKLYDKEIFIIELKYYHNNYLNKPLDPEFEREIAQYW